MTFRSFRTLGAKALLSAAALPALMSCVAGDYGQYRVFQEPSLASVQSLDPGTTDLTSTLEALGAPVHVIELGDRTMLAWGWQSSVDWNVDVSAPLGDAQGSFRFASLDEKTEGLVLVFDAAWVLQKVRRGHLVNLLPKGPRPRDVDLDLTPQPGA